MPGRAAIRRSALRSATTPCARASLPRAVISGSERMPALAALAAAVVAPTVARNSRRETGTAYLRSGLARRYAFAPKVQRDSVVDLRTAAPTSDSRRDRARDP